MLRGELEGADLERYVEQGVITTTLERALDWARGNSMFPPRSAWPAARSR
jgi:NADH-quinone oxidoreductase subunit B